MRRLQQREIDDLLALAERGGIGQAIALTDCIAAGPDQLMYMTDDTLILLKDEGDELLASCEGEVGWVKRSNIEVTGACASSSSPTASSFLDTPKPTQGELHHSEVDAEDRHEHVTGNSVAQEGGHPPAAMKRTVKAGGRYSGPFELEQTRFSHDGGDQHASHELLQDVAPHGDGFQHLAPTLSRSSVEGALARTISAASAASSSADSSGSGPIGRLVLGGNVQSDHTQHETQYEESPIGFRSFSSYASPSSASNALPPLRSLSGSGQNVKSVQRVNYTTIAPVKRQSLQAESAHAESSSTDVNPMEEVSEETEDDAAPDIRVEAAEGPFARGSPSPSPSPPGRPPRRRPVDLTIGRNSQLTNTSDSPAPQTPRSLDTFGGDGLSSRELLVSPDKSIQSGTSRDSDLRTSLVGGIFSSDTEADKDLTENLIAPRRPEEERFSLAYLRDSYGSDAEVTPRPDKPGSPIVSRITTLPLTASPPAASDSLDHHAMPMSRTTPSQDDTEDEITLNTPQSSAVSSFARHGLPTVMGSQSSELSALAAPIAFDEGSKEEYLLNEKFQQQNSRSSAAFGSPSSTNSHSVESHSSVKASPRGNNLYALAHSPHVAQQSWKDAADSIYSSHEGAFPEKLSAAAELRTEKALPSKPTASHVGRKLSYDAVHSASSEDRPYKVFNNQSTSVSPNLEERLDDRSGHGWSQANGHLPQRAQQGAAFDGYAPSNGNALHYADRNGSSVSLGSGGDSNVHRTPPQASPWGQQRNLAKQRSPPTNGLRPMTPDHAMVPNGDFARRLLSPSSKDKPTVEVVARPLDAFQQPPRNWTPAAPPTDLENGKLSLSTAKRDSLPRPPIPDFYNEQQSSSRSSTPTDRRPGTPSSTNTPRSRARSRSFSAAIAKTMGRARKPSFDLPMPTPIVDAARQRSASPTMATSPDRTPVRSLQLPSGNLRPMRASQASMRAVHHMPMEGEHISPKKGSHAPSRSISGSRPSAESLFARPATGMKGQYTGGVPYADPTVRTDGMEFELLQPRKTADGAPMISLNFDTTDLSFGALLGSEGHTDSESSHGAAIPPSSDTHHTHHSVDHLPPALDEWGFIKDHSPTPVIFQSRQTPSEVRAAEQKWLDIISKPIPYNGSAPKKVRRLVIEQGVPPSVRGRVWDWYLSNGLSGRVDGLFSRLLTNEPGEFDDQINCDVGRVYCDHGAFWRRNSPGQQDLRTLLRAYVHFAPSGYKSELALIAGALLIHSDTIEDAFWLMAGLFNGTLKTYYAKDKTAFNIDIHVFAGILAGSEPQLSNLFRDVGVAPHDYLKQWWMSLYIRCLPWPTVMRFFDTIISEGPRYMFISALAVLTLSRDRLLALPRNRDAVLGYLRHLPQDSLLLPDNFMRACDAVKLRSDDLKKMRTSVKERLATGPA